MDAEPSSNVRVAPRRQRGVAMFAVLGAIVVVSLLGLVGLTLATKDQSLSGDLADIKSRDQVALAGLQLAVNSLTANPANMVAQLNAFIQDARTNTTPQRCWLAFPASSSSYVTVSSTEPSYTSLSTLSGDQSAVKVKILGMVVGDTSCPINSCPVDSQAIYIALQCMARGRHGDLRTVQGTYRIQGVALALNQTVTSNYVPKYAFYVGGTVANNNLALNVTGDVYTGNSSGSLNGNSALTVNGTLKWNGNLVTNSPVTIDSNVFVNGYVNTNSGGTLRVLKNLGIANGFSTMNDSVVVSGNLWVGGTGDGSSWGSNAWLKVGGDLVFWPSGKMTRSSGRIRVGGNAWFLSGMQGQNLTDSIFGSLYVSDTSPVPFAFTYTDGNTLYTGKNFVVAPKAPRTITFTNSATAHVVDSLYFNNNTTLSSGAHLIVDSSGHAYATFGNCNTSLMVNGTLRVCNIAFGHANYVSPPTATNLGLDSIVQLTDTGNNVMDSIKVDSVHSLAVLNHMVTLNAALLQTVTKNTSNQTSDITPTSMNRLFAYLDSLGKTYNGYMILNLASSSGISNFSDDTGGFLHKAIYVVDGSYNVNGGWPHSHDSTNIQIIDIRGPAGDLASWGWAYGDFSGVVYWENPACGGHKLQLPTSGAHVWRGSFLMGKNSSCSSNPVSLDGSDGKVTLIKSDAVYIDINRNLSGVLTAGKTTTGQTSGTIVSTTTIVKTPLLRQTTSKPFFETKSIYR